MTKTIWTGMCAAIVGVAATAAITAQTTASSQSNAGNDARKITVTGCLQQAPPSSTDAGANGPAGTAGTAGTAGAAGAADAGDAAAPLNFVLTNATASSVDAAGAASPAGAPAPGSAAASGVQRYRLVANPSALTPHVGKKLELTGTLDDSRTKPPEPSEALTLKVESGKVVAASCSQ
jgi:hypothetical protein